jgi:hypothetical protein
VACKSLEGPYLNVLMEGLPKIRKEGLEDFHHCEDRRPRVHGDLPYPLTPHLAAHLRTRFIEDDLSSLGHQIEG